ncbi:MAG: DUF1349 domain-containing protein [Candidatus Cloacimonetes bacterium]|nr:DUF1349 domain-containing protein [Candidatus Cloacimonadota bacterium]
MKKQFRIIFIVIGMILIPLITNAQVTPISDDFFPETTANPFWSLYDPVGDADLLLTGTNAKLSVPFGVEHDLWTSNSDAPRLLQTAPDSNFTIEVKFESTPITSFQLQGIIVQETNDKFIRFGTYSNGSPILFCAVIDGTTLIQLPPVPIILISQHFLKVDRTGDIWTYSYSDDGESWSVAATFTQAFTVTEVGFYAGNSGGNPAFTANADYFMNHADPIIDDDSQPPSPPVIDIWYGSTQNFGQLGNPQTWVNILGRVTDDISVSSLTYTLNGGTSTPLVIGPNGTRLIGYGDFIIEIDRSTLLNGVNTVAITAMDGEAITTIDTVMVNYTAGNIWPTPYTADWSSISSIEDIDQVAEVVDGLWELVTGGIKTVETGYDRLLLVGDQTWVTNYEVEVPITIHSNQGDAGIGFAFGWDGHTGSTSPRTGWPLQSIGWVRYQGGSPQLRILTYTTGIQASQVITITNGVTYRLKARSEAIGSGQSRFYVKIWEDGTAEPETWMIQADIATRDGSVLMITHKADVTWGNMTITPLASNLSPQFTSTPVTSAEIEHIYTYNITASDPNAGDILSISATTLPDWLTLTDNGDKTATLTGLPTVPDVGINEVELLVEDQELLNDTQIFNIIVASAGQTFPISDNFCDGTTLNTEIWEFYDPVEDCSVILNNGNAEISIPGGTGSHDLHTNLAPRLLQNIPDEDFAVQIEFDSAPAVQFQMQGFVVQTSTGARLRFETYFGSEPYFYVNTYGVSVTGLPINQAIGGAIPQYLKLDRTGNEWTFDYSYDGTLWDNVSTYTLDVPVEKIGFYGANHDPNPAFTAIVNYFWNLDQSFPGCITLLAPNGGETYTVGDSLSVSWTSQDITNVKIELSTNGGTSWTELIASTNASTGTYSTIVPNSPSSACKIKVTDTGDASCEDVSDNVFTIIAGSPVNVSIEIIDGGSSIKISWDNEGYEYKIYSCDDPYGTFDSLETTVTNTGQVILPAPAEAKKFYRVTAE